MNRDLLAAITRIKTVNIGNEALSSELLMLLNNIAARSNKSVVALERAPRHLAQFSWRGLRSSKSDTLAQVDNWVRKLSAITPTVPKAIPNRKIELVFDKAQDKRVIAVKELLQLRSMAARLGVYQQEFAERLGVYLRSSCVVLNPAGELNPHSVNPPLRMLTELLTAKQLGSRIGVINFSYEITEPTLAPVFGQLFERCDFICVRDSLSRDVLIDSGVSKHRLHLVPDLVFLAEPCTQTNAPELLKSLGMDINTVAVVINGKTGLSSPEDWVQLIGLIRASGKPVALMSNELSSDIDFLRSVASASGAQLIDRQFSYREYSALLSQLSLVVSNRLHTCVLAIVAGTPVIAIEPILRKVRGVLQDLDYPLPVPSVRDKGWVNVAWDSFQKAAADRERLVEDVAAKVAIARQKIRSGYDKVIV